MKEKVKQHLVDYNICKGWGTDRDTLIETLREAEIIYRKELSHRRWWVEYRYVVNIEGMFIGFTSAEATGDAGAQEVGWEFDPTSIEEMKPLEITQTIYVPVEDAQ